MNWPKSAHKTLVMFNPFFPLAYVTAARYLTRGGYSGSHGSISAVFSPKFPLSTVSLWKSLIEIAHSCVPKSFNPFHLRHAKKCQLFTWHNETQRPNFRERLCGYSYYWNVCVEPLTVFPAPRLTPTLNLHTRCVIIKRAYWNYISREHTPNPHLPFFTSWTPVLH